ncbi:1-phosphofructokinase [Bacillus sp. 2205SS5-2]|uniref:1-phosphofructokinase n=1 Tax=Bacillus sp. 2205SS5-2 TaxID=3109031 RepID=UPI003006AC9A
MIYTITLNPSLDYMMTIEDFEIGSLNRANDTDFYPGGKGIMVSRMLRVLEEASTATGFLGGFTGDFIAKKLEKEEINTSFFKVNDASRINVKVSGKEETELNAPGPPISQTQIDELMSLIKNLTSEDALVLAGSVPSSIPSNFYEEIAKICFEKDIRFVVDAEKHLLLPTLKHKPYLIKPNHHELGEIFDTTISTHEDALYYGKKLLEMGPQHIIISMGGNGAVFLSEALQLIGEVPRGEIISTIGSGDSTVAGFLAAITKGRSLFEAFGLGLASGTASAFTSGLASNEEIVKMIPYIKIESIHQEG